MAKMAIWAIYSPYGHDQRLNQYARYGYPGKELKHTNSTVKTSAQLDIPIKSYACFTILGQIYIVKMAIFDQFYHHRKEWSYSDFKDIFGNGMACGQRWQHGRTLILTLVFIRIALFWQYPQQLHCGAGNRPLSGAWS